MAKQPDTPKIAMSTLLTVIVAALNTALTPHVRPETEAAVVQVAFKRAREFIRVIEKDYPDFVEALSAMD